MFVANTMTNFSSDFETQFREKLSSKFALIDVKALEASKKITQERQREKGKELIKNLQDISKK